MISHLPSLSRRSRRHAATSWSASCRSNDPILSSSPGPVARGPHRNSHQNRPRAGQACCVALPLTLSHSSRDSRPAEQPDRMKGMPASAGAPTTPFATPSPPSPVAPPEAPAAAAAAMVAAGEVAATVAVAVAVAVAVVSARPSRASRFSSRLFTALLCVARSAGRCGGRAGGRGGRARRGRSMITAHSTSPPTSQSAGSPFPS
mmetsp:Transcript_26575/g.77618  ORF Transcript_26575/g.77618 Transcript_26575/m.77618 type:complete len:204 (-) Transcript_26575:904-1515(-)